MKTENVAEALTALCSDMFGSSAVFPSEYWAANFPTEVILYALVEAQDKRRRTPDMIPRQIMNFANTIMERKLREEQKRKAA